MRLGAKVPNLGPGALDPGITGSARQLEAAGFESLWLSDHIVIPGVTRSRYPFSPSGVSPSPPDTAWFDAVVSLAQVAAVTERAEIGIGVAVLPLRNPVEFAKQMASIDALAGGRVVLGVGAGWLAEEFEALGVPFSSRGSRLDEGIELLRSCWTGRPPAFDGAHFQLPADLHCYPTPVHEIPILIGGMSPAALRRAATTADGWFAYLRADAPDVSSVEAAVHRLSGRRVVVRIGGPIGLAASHLAALADLGVDDVVVDVDWTLDGGAERAMDELRSATG